MRLVMVMLMAGLAGCSSAPNSLSDEQRMAITENYQGLQAEYRERLIADPADYPAAVKLAQAYFKTADMEAAGYYLDYIPDQACHQTAGCWLAKADLAYARSDFPLAKKQLEASLAARHDIFAAKNLYGIILAREGNFPLAKQYLFEARLGFDDEDAIRNNLAMVDMLEGNYRQAADRLMPVYKKGSQDPTIRANLIVSLMRSGQVDLVYQMLVHEHGEEQALTVFVQLKEDLLAWPLPQRQEQATKESKEEIQ